MAESDTMGFGPNFEEDEDEKSMKTLTYILVTDRRKGLGSGREISMVINNLQQAVKNISQLVRSYGLFKGMQTGKLSTKSFDHKNLLKKCEMIFVKSLATMSTVCLVGSYYSNELLEINNPEHGKFVVTFVPLEGNMSLNYKLVSGSIFSVYKKVSKEGVAKEDFLQSGTSIVTAGYALYGKTTVFVLAPAPRTCVMEFLLDPDSNEFIMVDSKLEIPSHGSLYSLNEGRSRSMDTLVLETVTRKKAVNIARGKSLKCRYTGSIIADAHSIIKEGGLFIAPAYSDYPLGMLKTQFFGNPLAFIVQEAGGASSDGLQEYLELFIDDPHQNSPIYLGSVKEHQEFIRILASASKLSNIRITSQL